jgi:hypothetical protein
MLKQQAKAKYRINLKSFRFSRRAGAAPFAIIPGSDYGFRGKESPNANARAG